MDAREFHVLVARSEAVTEPEPITRATLETLGEALAADQTTEIAPWLPDPYARQLDAADGPAESIGTEAFYDRVRARESAADAADGVNAAGTDETDVADAVEAAGDVRPRIGAVVDALATTVPHDDLRDIRAQVPDRVGSLFTE